MNYSFKAEIINNFIEKNDIQTIIDYGVGDGNQLKLINTKDKYIQVLMLAHLSFQNVKD